MPRRAAAQIRPISRTPCTAPSRPAGHQQGDAGRKKSTAEAIVYSALAVPASAGKDLVESLDTSIKALTPVLEVRSRRVGGATYQVPVEVPARRVRTLAVRWLVGRPPAPQKTMAQRLANELYNAYPRQGERIEAQDDIHNMAQANKAFAHYRW